MKLIKKILDESKGPKALVIMGVVSFIESIFFIIPPDPFLGLICIFLYVSCLVLAQELVF